MRGFMSFLEVLWSCSAIDERKVLLDVVDSWDEMMEPNGFAMPNPPRTSRSSYTWVKPSLSMRVCR
jgi:hypothetical protein